MASQAGGHLAGLATFATGSPRNRPFAGLALGASDTRPRRAASCTLWWRLVAGVLLAACQREMAAIGFAESGVFAFGVELPQDRGVERRVGGSRKLRVPKRLRVQGRSVRRSDARAMFP